jgi:tRNA threonylcarbamoyl adenosine modification protein YeaZ
VSALWLALDASSPRASAALAESGELLSEASGPARGGPPLLELAQIAFAEADRRPSELAGVVAVSGPGSFTGVRVTLATALGIAPAGGPVALRTVSSLAALAMQGGETEGELLAIVDALRGDWFHQRFVRRDGAPVATGEPERRPAAEIGLPPSRFAIAFAETGLDARSGWSSIVAAPLASRVARAASIGADAAPFRADIEPLYLRAAAATPAKRALR